MQSYRLTFVCTVKITFLFHNIVQPIQHLFKELLKLYKMRLYVCLERLFISALRFVNTMALLVESVMACDEKVDCLAWIL